MSRTTIWNLGSAVLIAVVLTIAVIGGCWVVSQQRRATEQLQWELNRVLPAEADTEECRRLAELIRAGADVHVRSASGGTVLHSAARAGDLRLARAALGHHADPMARDKVGLTPLHLAAPRGDDWLVRVLLQAGADANALEDTLERTALMLSSTEAVSAELLRAGAQVNARDSQGNTPFIYAAANGNLPQAELLLRSGADPRIKSSKGEAALSQAPPDKRKELRVLIARFTR